jgi:hypothetical protein
MDLSLVAVRLTIWLSVLAWVAAEWRRTSPTAVGTSGRTAWTLGALAALAHAATALHVHHGWSHAAALADTARQTAVVTGLGWGGGLYVNYAFLAVWSADAAWWWRAADTFERRPRGLDGAIRAFVWLMFVNGAFVFVIGSMRWVGAAAALAVLAAWYRGRGRKGREHG